MDEHPTPFLDLLTLWRQGWLKHAEILRAAEAAHVRAPAAERAAADPACGCLPACC